MGYWLSAGSCLVWAVLVYYLFIPYLPLQSYPHEQSYNPHAWANRSEFKLDNGYSIETFLHEALMASSHRCGACDKV